MLVYDRPFHHNIPLPDNPMQAMKVKKYFDEHDMNRDNIYISIYSIPLNWMKVGYVDSKSLQPPIRSWLR